MTKDELRKIMDAADFSTDLSQQKASRAFTESERALIAVTQAINAAVVQFSLEGLLSPKEHVHFMMHLNDFVNRLFKGERVTFPQLKALQSLEDKSEPAVQSFTVDSKMGEVFLASAQYALEHGSDVYEDQKRMVQEFTKQEPEAEKAVAVREPTLDEDQQSRFIDPEAGRIKRSVN